jgi:pyruvate kinase
MRSIDVLRRMSDDCMTVIRLNLSHGTFEDYEKDFALIKTLNTEYGRNIKVLVDLEGHRVRIGNLKNERVKLRCGQKFILTNREIIGDSERVFIDYKNSLADVKIGFDVFIDDGNLALKVLSSGEKELVTEVQNDYVLKMHKGVNIPQANLKFPLMEKRDLDGLKFALGSGVDFVANSFVRDAEDMKPLIDILKAEKNTSCKLIAKIENRLGIDNLENIIKVSDGIMVARGDLGISIPIWTVPIEQKRIIKQCRIYNKFVIIATQLLESMVKNPIPTRAEVSDVANAVLDGADYVMLSAETAVGKYPNKAVKMIKDVLNFTEMNSQNSLSK